MKDNPSSIKHFHAHHDGFSYCIRPINKDDKNKLIELFNRLSPESRYLRFAHAISKLPDEFLEDVLDLDYKQEMALVAVISHNNIEKIIGIARYVTKESEDICEFSISVGDEYAAHGVGINLMKRLVNHAQQQNLKKMIGYILNGNTKMLKMVKELGFHINKAPLEPGFKIAELDLNN